MNVADEPSPRIMALLPLGAFNISQSNVSSSPSASKLDPPKTVTREPDSTNCDYLIIASGDAFDDTTDCSSDWSAPITKSMNS